MRTESVLYMLSRYGAKYPEVASTVDQFSNFVSEKKDCFHRTLKEGHVTGSAWVVNETGRKVLLTHHKKLGRWLQMGGHADGESDILAVALREVKEESGLDKVEPISREIFDIDIHMIPQTGSEAEHFHYDIRFALVNLGNEEFVVSEESHDLCWVEISDLSEFTKDESMLRMARKWRAQPVAGGDAAR